MSSLAKVRWADRKGWQCCMHGVMNAKMPRPLAVPFDRHVYT